MKKTTSCPTCASEISVNPGFEPWCQACGWGCEANAPAADGLSERIHRRLGQRFGERLFLELKNSENHVRKPKPTISLALAYALAIPVHLATLGLLAAGIWFLTINWFHFVPFTIGLCLIGAAYALRPRFGKPPVYRLSRNDAPELYGLVDDVAHALDTKTIDEIYVEPVINGAYGRHGIHQRRYLMVGSPLWLSLDGAGKVALIAHELAHQVNGDFSRGYWIATAIGSLQDWLGFLRQPHLQDEDASIITHYIFLVLSVPVYLLLYALTHLSWNTSQRAEYLADYLGSRVSGTSSYISADERMSVLIDHTQELSEMTKDHALAPERIIPAFVSKFSAIPSLEIERMRRINSKELLTLDSTHPPTHYRCRLLEAFPCSPAISITEEQSEKLNAEVAALNDVMGKMLVNEFVVRPEAGP